MNTPKIDRDEECGCCGLPRHAHWGGYQALAAGRCAGFQSTATTRLRAAAPDMLAALRALAGPMEAVRDDQASLGLRFGSTPAARAERARLLIDWIKANADRVDDALELAFAAIAKAEGRA